MKTRKPECKHCSSKSATVKLYWCTNNLLKMPMKTHYCDHCAAIIVPKQEHIEEGKKPA